MMYEIVEIEILMIQQQNLFSDWRLINHIISMKMNKIWYKITKVQKKFYAKICYYDDSPWWWNLYFILWPSNIKLNNQKVQPYHYCFWWWFTSKSSTFIYALFYLIKDIRKNLTKLIIVIRYYYFMSKINLWDCLGHN